MTTFNLYTKDEIREEIENDLFERGERENDLEHLQDLYRDREYARDVAMRACDLGLDEADELWDEFVEIDSEFWALNARLED